MSVLFQLRLEGLRVLAGDPDVYPRWMLAQGTLFVLLLSNQPAPASWARRESERLGIEPRELAAARRALRVASLRCRGRRETLWHLPVGLDRGIDLVRFDRRWRRYLW